MYNVSQAYKESMKNPIRNHSYMKVMLGLINQEAQASAEVENQTQYTGFSDLQTIFTKNDIGNQYATYEQGFWKADGEKLFIPRDESDYIKNGLITYGLFSGTVLIQFSFGYGASDIRGLTIQFGECYPTEFTVITSDGTEYPYENDSDYFETDQVFENTESITLKIEAMSIPNNRVRIFYVKFGLGLEYDNEWIQSADSSWVLSAINDDLPEVEFSVKLRNDDQRFNVDNPSSEINFLETGQRVSVSQGYELDDGSIEWLQLHTLYVQEWSADDSQATIKTVDRFKYMSDNYYKGQYYEDGITLYDLAVLVLEDAGMEPSEYYIDSYLKKVTVYNPIPDVTHKEALQIIANAGRCIMDYDRYGRIRIYSAFLPDFKTTSNGTVYYSDVTAIDHETQKNLYATYAQDYWKADGKMLFVPESGVQDAGYVSEQISGSDGLFTENPIITRTLEAKYKCFGLRIFFTGNLPKKFIIRTYADGTLNDTVEITSNIAKNYELSYSFQEFDKMEIEFVETEVPNNRIQIDYISFGAETNYTVEYDDQYTTPTGTQLEKIKQLKTSRKIYTKSNTQEELANDKVVYAGENVLYYFSDACYGYSVSLEEESSGSVSIVSSGAYYVEIAFSGVSVDTEVRFSITGYKYNVSTAYYSVDINNRGSDKQWDNPLISDEEHCKDVCQWLADYYASGVEYQLDYRGDPALDTGDTIFQENKYVDDLKVVIEEIQQSFNGAIRGALRTRRKERVDRAKNGLGGKRYS